LNQLIIDHYAFHEIGAETPARFKHYLNTTLQEEMPLFNQLYTSALSLAGALKNRDLTHTLTNSGTNSSTQASSSNAANTQQSDNLAVHSDTPASLLSAANIKANLYASAADRGDNLVTTQDSGSSAATGSGTNTQTMTEYFTGLDGMTNAAAVKELRDLFINIDKQVINSLATCFMGVY
jgi:hypothetical protein